MSRHKENMDKLIKGCHPQRAYDYALNSRLMIGGLYFLCLIDSYILMLIVMTFNVGLFIATVLGLTAGYFIFGLILGDNKTDQIYNPETDKCCT